MAYFRDKFKSIFTVKDTPHRIALAFALGVFVGISPFLGLHYLGAFFMAWLFRLNKLVAIVGVSVNNPWTIMPISTFCIWIGAKMMGIREVLPEVDWAGITLTKIVGKFTDFESLISMTKKLWPVLSSFFVGSMLICTLSAIASYFIIQIFLARYKKEETCRIN
ncbi:MAG: DUF2062 domain-containing protein [Nitrospiraceae bacterium]|nr:MAG: DUF2062 domain-containing protein [Nitrospiraceae bacterium]